MRYVAEYEYENSKLQIFPAALNIFCPVYKRVLSQYRNVSQTCMCLQNTFHSDTQLHTYRVAHWQLRYTRRRSCPLLLSDFNVNRHASKNFLELSYLLVILNCIFEDVREDRNTQKRLNNKCICDLCTCTFLAALFYIKYYI